MRSARKEQSRELPFRLVLNSEFPLVESSGSCEQHHSKSVVVIIIREIMLQFDHIGCNSLVPNTGDTFNRPTIEVAKESSVLF